MREARAPERAGGEALLLLILCLFLLFFAKLHIASVAALSSLLPFVCVLFFLCKEKQSINNNKENKKT
jgi:Ca2+/Na+ antiporter